MRRDELAGLALALAAHAGLVAWLALSPPSPRPLPVPERMEVTFSKDIAEKSTSPEPKAQAQAAPAVAPVLAANPVPEPAPSPAPPVPAPPPPKPAPIVKPEPAPRPRPVAHSMEAAKPVKPQPEKQKSAPEKPVPEKPAKAKPDARPAGGGGSRIGSDFLKGAPGADAKGKATTPPAQAMGPAVKSALIAAVSRQIRPHWRQPDGVDVDKLSTTLEWDLNPDGTLAGNPRFVSQSGANAANQPQAERHKEQAIRAVRLSAPFDLPPDLYDGWRHMRFTFDWKLN